MLGSRKFNNIHRGVPRMSRGLLAKRLQKLIECGVISSADIITTIQAGGCFIDAGGRRRDNAHDAVRDSVVT